MHIKNIHKTIEEIAECAKSEVCKGLENLDTKEMSEVADILKDLCEAEYYATITKAMEEAEYGEEYDIHGPMEGRRYYRGRARDSMGRFKSRRGYDEVMHYDHMYPDEYYRDMDREHGRMYYTEHGHSMSRSEMHGEHMGMRDHREGRSGMSRRSYMETKEARPGSTSEDKQARTRELETYLSELSSDLTEMIAGSSAEEKAMLKSKMQTLLSKI